MIGTLVIGVGILLILTAWVTYRVRDRDLKAVWVAPLWGVLAIGVLVGGVGVWYINARLVYERCAAQAERSEGGRRQNEQLYDTIDEATGTDEYTSAPVIPGLPSLRDALDVNLPVLDKADCPKP